MEPELDGCCRPSPSDLPSNTSKRAAARRRRPFVRSFFVFIYLFIRLLSWILKPNTSRKRRTSSVKWGPVVTISTAATTTCPSWRFRMLTFGRAGSEWVERFVAVVRSGQVPGKKDSASMAVKGERDPAARAHIHPTSSRKPVVAEATPVRGRGHGQDAPAEEGGSSVDAVGRRMTPSTLLLKESAERKQKNEMKNRGRNLCKVLRTRLQIQAEPI